MLLLVWDGVVSLKWDLQTRVKLDISKVGERGGGSSGAWSCQSVLIGVWCSVWAGLRKADVVGLF